MLPFVIGAGLLANSIGTAKAGLVQTVRSTTLAKDGRLFWAENHLVTSALPGVKSALQAGGASASAVGGPSATTSKEFLVVWAGDQNAADTTGADIQKTKLQVNPERLTQVDGTDALVAPDFLAVIDADKDSPTYGKVVNTVTVGPLVENEPHHMQYLYHKGDKVFAGGLYSDTTYVLDVSKLPFVSLSGVNLPTDTPCGSIPDAYWTMPDHTAYATYMGGADVPGPCRYTNGEIRFSNGFGGSPGSIVHLAADGSTISETPAALATGEDPTNCPNLPAIPGKATCANPHGVQARPDLGILVASDYAEPRNIVLDPVKPPLAGIFRDTVRIYDITDGVNAKLKSVAVMPDGPRKERNPGHEEPRGIMETTVTNLPGHKGAFASSMCGGVIYYTPDITAANPVWKEVFDDSTAAYKVNPQVVEGGGCDGGGWVQTSLDDKYLYHAVIGRGVGALDDYDTGSAKMVYTLDIQKLLAAGTATTCSIDTIAEVADGGHEADCPKLASVLPIEDNTTGGPHWGTPDNFVKHADGTYSETTDVKRIAISDYFVARTGVNGNHRVCLVNVGPKAELTLDTSFRDENEGTPCVDFNRSSWPHGKFGNAKPHSELFVVTDSALH